MEQPQPILEFSKIRAFLFSQGIEVEKKSTYTSIREEVKLNEDGKLNVVFENDTIAFVDSKGIYHQGFMYKRSYRLTEHGKPRFHICECNTIRSFINNGRFDKEYRFATDVPVPVIDIDDNETDKMVDDLPLCKYCINTVTNETKRMTDASEFVEYLKEKDDANPLTVKNVDIFGYTDDWSEVSKDYREQKNYTCESCGIEMNDVLGHPYCHVHHIDRDKTNNSTSNLKCLCIECHSKVDDEHRNNFRSASNIANLAAFAKYKENKNKKYDYEEIAQLFSDNEINYLYHFTSIENVEKIKEAGGLYSWNYLDEHGLTVPCPGGDELSRSLDKRDHLEDYVRLSFCKKHPMSYRLQKNGKQIVLLKIKTDVALLKDTRFSNMNATDNRAIKGIDVEFLREQVDFEATKRNYVSREDSDFKAHQAEILVKRHIPIDCIVNIDDPILL